MIQTKKQRFWRLLLTYGILILVILLIVYPLLWAIGASFNPGKSLVSTTMFPKNPTLNHYRELFAGKASLQYGQWYKNSLKISLFTMLGSLISVSFTAYAFSRFRFKGRQTSLILFLLLQMIPQFSALVALFVLAEIMVMMNTHWFLILTYIAAKLP